MGDRGFDTGRRLDRFIEKTPSGHIVHGYRWSGAPTPDECGDHYFPDPARGWECERCGYVILRPAED